ncbi:MAG TPA: RecX family transcriptional regulator [Allosphingosinicella sp.]|jgi:regulatory protein
MMGSDPGPTRAAKRARPPLDAEGLERLGLFYAGRYATTRARLADYLRRKLRERGWGGTGAPPVEALVERFAGLGYVNDAAFAEARAGSLLRRGYGERRVAQALRAAGIDADDAAPARAEAERQAEEAALRFARRRRIGPYAERPPADDREGREARRKAAAAMLRAGHRLDLVRRILDASPGELPDPDLA